MSQRIPTFRDCGKLLTGAAASEAWAAQTAKCACGSCGDKDNAIAGTAKDMPAQWLGCPNCTGQALGRPIVYRLPVQIRAAMSEMSAAATTPRSQ